MAPPVIWFLKRLAVAVVAAILIVCMAYNVVTLRSKKLQRIELRKRDLEPVLVGKEKKLYVRLVSRMGNHHFQIATLIALAGQTGRTPVLTSGSGDDIFVLYPDLTIPVLDTVTVAVDKKMNENRTVSYSENLIADLKAQPGDVKICCFFESWRYFWPDYEQEVRKQFSVSREILSNANDHLWSLIASLGDEMVGAARQKDVTFVGVHVRRGDKLKSAYGFQIAPLSYFKNSMIYFRKKYSDRKLVFVVTSDERKWVKENIKGSNVVFSELQEAYEDFALLTICNHTISSVGTFSWWAGFLAGGDVLYYKHPTREGTLKHERFMPQDFYLPKWIPYE